MFSILMYQMSRSQNLFNLPSVLYFTCCLKNADYELGATYDLSVLFSACFRKHAENKRRVMYDLATSYSTY